MSAARQLIEAESGSRRAFRAITRVPGIDEWFAKNFNQANATRYFPCADKTGVKGRFWCERRFWPGLIQIRLFCSLMWTWTASDLIYSQTVLTFELKPDTYESIDVMRTVIKTVRQIEKAALNPPPELDGDQAREWLLKFIESFEHEPF
jgi:hypothetical protein